MTKFYDASSTAKLTPKEAEAAESTLFVVLGILALVSTWGLL